MSLASVRAALINEIWSGDGFPSNGADSVAIGVTNPLSVGATPSNLLRCDRFAYQTLDRHSNLITNGANYDGTVFNYLWRPNTPNGKLVLFHFGHSDDVNVASNGNYVIKELVELGYTVSGHIMPGPTANSPEHNTYPARTESMNFLRIFCEGPIRLINAIGGAFSHIYMAGHSGGAWATSLIAAIDTRIEKSWQNAGAMPLQNTTARDFEQFLPGVASWCDYHDLWLLGSDNGRKQRQSCNVNDTCCFNRVAYSAPGAISYHWPVKKRAAELGCNWDLIWDKNGGHEVTTATRNMIVDFFEDRVLTITQQPVAASVFVGGTATFTVALSFATGGHQWQELIAGAWASVVGATSTTLSVAVASESENGRIFRYTNDRGVVSNPVTLRVWSAALAAMIAAPVARFSMAGPLYSDITAGAGTDAGTGDKVGTWVSTNGAMRYNAAADASRMTRVAAGIQSVGGAYALVGNAGVRALLQNKSRVFFRVTCVVPTADAALIGFSRGDDPAGARLAVNVGPTSVGASARRIDDTAGLFSNTRTGLANIAGQTANIVVCLDYAANRLRAWRNSELAIDVAHGLGTANSANTASSRATTHQYPNGTLPNPAPISLIEFFDGATISDALAAEFVAFINS